MKINFNTCSVEMLEKIQFITNYSTSIKFTIYSFGKLINYFGL